MGVCVSYVASGRIEKLQLEDAKVSRKSKVYGEGRIIQESNAD